MLSSHHDKMALAHRAQPPQSLGTEVKSLGVKGGKHSKDGGVKDSYVSANKYAHIHTLSSHRHLLLTLSIPSLFDQVDGNVAKETEVKCLGVKGAKDSKDGGVVESYVSADSMLVRKVSTACRWGGLTLFCL